MSAQQNPSLPTCCLGHPGAPSTPPVTPRAATPESARPALDQPAVRGNPADPEAVLPQIRVVRDRREDHGDAGRPRRRRQCVGRLELPVAGRMASATHENVMRAITTSAVRPKVPRPSRHFAQNFRARPTNSSLTDPSRLGGGNQRCDRGAAREGVLSWLGAPISGGWRGFGLGVTPRFVRPGARCSNCSSSGREVPGSHARGTTGPPVHAGSWRTRKSQTAASAPLL